MPLGVVLQVWKRDFLVEVDHIAVACLRDYLNKIHYVVFLFEVYSCIHRDGHHLEDEVDQSDATASIYAIKTKLGVKHEDRRHQKEHVNNMQGKQLFEVAFGVNELGVYLFSEINQLVKATVV